jgi:type I restriction enzyme, S subunit
LTEGPPEVELNHFLAEFGYIAGTAAGVQRIRGLVLQLAISGDLTVRVPGDIAARDLLNANKAERARLVDEGKLQQQYSLDGREGEERPWPLPAGWLWCSLGEVTNYGHAVMVDLRDVNSRTWVLELEDIEKGTSKVIRRVRARDRQFRSPKKQFRKGAVLYSRLRPYLDKVIIADEDGVCTTEIVPITFFGYIESEYLRWYLKSPFFVAYATEQTHGMSLPRLGTVAARYAPFPLPPAEEQKRIVTKVNELMALCDRLEALYDSRERLSRITRAALVDAISNAPSDDALLQTWERLQHELPWLIWDAGDVAYLRAGILDLAATGRLSKPIDTDSRPEVLIAEAKAVRDHRIAHGELKSKKVVSTNVIDLDIPMPQHWAKSPVQDLFRLIDYRGKTPVKTVSGRVLVTAKNVRPGRLTRDPVEYISEAGYREWMTRGYPKAGDLLVTTEAPLGNIARIEETPTFALAQRVINLQPYATLNTKFFMYFMMGPRFQKMLQEKSTGTTAKGIKSAQIKYLTLCVPPLEEQQRIVARTEALLSLCDDLETKLERARSLNDHLTAACIAEITGIRSEDQVKMKTPQTELVTRLRVVNAPAETDPAPLATILLKHDGELSAKVLWTSSGLDINTFYQQLKIEVENGWVEQPEAAYVKEVEVG